MTVKTKLETIFHPNPPDSLIKKSFKARLKKNCLYLPTSECSAFLKPRK